MMRLRTVTLPRRISRKIAWQTETARDSRSPPQPGREPCETGLHQRKLTINTERCERRRAQDEPATKGPRVENSRTARARRRLANSRETTAGCGQRGPSPYVSTKNTTATEHCPREVEGACRAANKQYAYQAALEPWKPSTVKINRNQPRVMKH